MGRTTRAFLLSVIAQMAKEIPDFYDRLMEIDKDIAKIHSMSTRILWQKVFVDVLFQITRGQTWFWVFDASDKAEKPGEVISFISKIPPELCVRVLVTSRVGVELERDFQKLKYVLG